MSIYNTGIPTMPMYDVTKRTFGQMMTPEDQIMWLYYHMTQEASVEYVDAENARQDAALTAYQAQMLLTLDALRKGIMADVGAITTYGTLWTCQTGTALDSKTSVRWIHRDACALYGAKVSELGSGLNRLSTVQDLAESNLSVFGMAAYAKQYSLTGTIDAPGATITYGYPFTPTTGPQ